MQFDPDRLSAIRAAMELTGVEWMYLDADGFAVLPEGRDGRVALPEPAAGQRGVPVRFGGRTLISPDGRTYLCLCAQGDEIDTYARLACEVVRRSCGDGEGRAGALRRSLDGTSSARELEGLGLADGRRRCAMCVRLAQPGAEDGAVRVIGSLSEDGSDLYAGMGNGEAALVHAMADEESAPDAEQYAQALAQSVALETGSNAAIGISRVFTSPGELPGAYREAREAAEIGRRYHRNRDVFPFAKLLPERLLSRIPKREADECFPELPGALSARSLGEETLRDVETLFENSLNLSETARKLYIHRNTLVYRLDKIARSTGLDLRSFDDAMTFRLLMLLESGRDGKGGGNT